MFNYNHLYYFYITAKLGGVMKAASFLRIAQPALSTQIKTLESQLKRQLFQKSGRRLILTADGQRAFGFCKRAFEATAEFADYLEHSDKDVRPKLTIGISPEIERPFLSDALSAILRAEHKDGKPPLVSMQTASPEKLLERLKTREQDAAVTARPLYGSGIKPLVHMQMPVVAVATPALAKKLRITSQAPLSALLRSQPDAGLILPNEALRLRIETDLHLQKAKIRNPVIFESDILAVVTRATLDGVGVAFLPMPYIRAELNRESLVIIGKPKSLWRHSVYFSVATTSLTNTLIGPIQKHFEDIAQECKSFV